MVKEVISITTEKAIDIINNLLSDNCDDEQKEAVEYIKYFLTEYQPIEDFTNTHILSTEALHNALSLLNSYYQIIPDESWKQLKEIMFTDKDMNIPKRYPANQCNLYRLFTTMLHRITDGEYGHKNAKNNRPKILINDEKYGILDFTYHFFTGDELLVYDLFNLSLIWDDLYAKSETTTLYSYQLEIAEWFVGRRLATDFCELMSWLGNKCDVMDLRL